LALFTRTHALISLAARIPLDIYLRERESRKGDELLITYLRSLHGCLCQRASSMDIQKKPHIPLALRARESGALISKSPQKPSALDLE